MIVLNKKRLILVISTVFISIFIFLLTPNFEEDKYVETVSLPVSGKTIVVDAGHGIPDE